MVPFTGVRICPVTHHVATTPGMKNENDIVGNKIRCQPPICGILNEAISCSMKSQTGQYANGLVPALLNLLMW